VGESAYLEGETLICLQWRWEANELFRVAVKSGIIYFATSKDIRVTVNGSLFTLKILFFSPVVPLLIFEVDLEKVLFGLDSRTLGLRVKKPLHTRDWR
jgi:hypothetical protein